MTNTAGQLDPLCEWSRGMPVTSTPIASGSSSSRQ